MLSPAERLLTAAHDLGRMQSGSLVHEVFPLDRNSSHLPDATKLGKSDLVVQVVTIGIILTNLSRIPSTLPILVESRRMLPW